MGTAYCPTDAFPGSLRKVEVMSERRRLDLPLFHPQDALAPDVRTSVRPVAGPVGNRPEDLEQNYRNFLEAVTRDKGIL